MNVNIPVKNIVSKPKFQTVMESYCDFVTSHSDKVRRIVDDLAPAMESACIDEKTNMLSIPTAEGRIFIAPEAKYRKEIQGLYNELF